MDQESEANKANKMKNKAKTYLKEIIYANTLSPVKFCCFTFFEPALTYIL